MLGCYLELGLRPPPEDRTVSDRAEVMAIDEAEGSVRVRYLDAMGEPEFVNTEAWISGDEVIAIDMRTHSEGPT